MNPFLISSYNLGRLFWRSIFYATLPQIKNEYEKLLSIYMSRSALIHNADYKTGSVNFSAVTTLFALSRYFAPKFIAEVGTFIGRTTGAFELGIAAEDSKHAHIFTCDYSNEILLPRETAVSMTQFPKKSSAEMFQHIAEQGIQCDFIFVDGRLGKDDIALIPRVSHEETIFILDDFEGIEKGVANGFALSSIMKNGILIPPYQGDLEQAISGLTRNTVALILPKSMLRLVSQAE